MPITDDFKKCCHNALPNLPADVSVPAPMPILDWRDCHQCIDEVKMQLVIARAYLQEIQMAEFNDNGVCSKPFKEPVQGRGFQQIAATGLSMASD